MHAVVTGLSLYPSDSADSELPFHYLHTLESLLHLHEQHMVRGC